MHYDNPIFKSKLIAVDTETTGLNPWRGDRLFGISMADANDNDLWIQWLVDPFTREVHYDGIPLTVDASYKQVKEILEDETVTKVFFNAPYDIRMLEFADINVSGPIEESSLAVRICGVERIYWKLKPLCKQFFEISDDDEKSLKAYTRTLRGRAKLLGYNLGENLSQDYWLMQCANTVMLKGLFALKTYQDASEAKQVQLQTITNQHAAMMTDSVAKYGTIDAIRTITTWLFFSEMLKEKNLYGLYEEENELLINCTYEMISKGLQLDINQLKSGLTKAKHHKAKARFKINKSIWFGFNPQSTKQKQRYFFDYRKLQPLSHSKKTMNPSCDETFLEYYAKVEDGAKAIVDFTKASKVKSTYFDWMISSYDNNQVLHPDLNQFGTLTGRYSGRLLTMPKRAPDGHIMLDVRKCFVPRDGCYWLMPDYKQIEARIYADEFNETTMLEAFENDNDVYVALEETIEEHSGFDVGRQIAKNIFLGKIYGLGLDHLIEMIIAESHEDVSIEGAADIIDAFDNTFPIVNESMKRVQRMVERMGFIRNRYGQVIYVPYDFAYKGVNYTIQSTAQRIIKRAMLALIRQQVVDFESVSLLLQMHDELVFEVSNDIDPDDIIPTINELMTNTNGHFPDELIQVEFAIAKNNWLDKEDIE